MHRIDTILNTIECHNYTRSFHSVPRSAEDARASENIHDRSFIPDIREMFCRRCLRPVASAVALDWFTHCALLQVRRTRGVICRAVSGYCLRLPPVQRSPRRLKYVAYRHLVADQSTGSSAGPSAGPSSGRRRRPRSRVATTLAVLASGALFLRLLATTRCESPGRVHVIVGVSPTTMSVT